MKLQKLNSIDAKRTGAACEICGMTFVNLKDGKAVIHGTAVVCHQCWKGLSGFEKKLYHRAKRDTATI